jgi:phosphatidylserine/phosphatidylglycerophosphate/cardiolipin synthase-like enzyme
VRIIVEPSDSGSALLSAIGAASKSIHMTMYLLTDSAMIDALVARHKAGVDVKIILNEHFPPGVSTSNAASYSALKSAGVHVVWAPAGFAYTHEKTLVLDGKTAWIMTMNASKAAVTANREYLAIDTTAADVTEAEAQFAADYAGTPYTPSGNLLMSPVTARPGILSLISGARTSLDFEDEELSDAAATAALCSARARGVRVRGVLSNGTASSAQQSAVAQLKKCGVTMVSLSDPYVHAKAIVADGARIYVGSANLTAGSLDNNRELGLATATTAAVTPVAMTVAADIAAGSPL